MMRELKKLEDALVPDKESRRGKNKEGNGAGIFLLISNEILASLPTISIISEVQVLEKVFLM